MRYFLILVLAVLLAACNEGVITEIPVDGPSASSVTFSLDADMRNDIADVKSDAEGISVDDFWVEIFNSSKMRIFCERYVDAKDTTLYVNSGDYTLLATYGTETGVGFDKPFYKAEEPFTVGPQETKALCVTATLANVKVAVNFDENLGNRLSYEQYWAVVRNNGKKLRFNPDETRAGYIPAGELEFVLVVKINGEYKQYVHPAAEYAPNDFVTFNVSAPLLDGNIALTVKIDDSVEVVTLPEVVIPADQILPVDEPAIYSEGFDAENTVTFVEGKAQELNELWLSATAGGKLASAVLTFDGELSGLPQSVDLVTADASAVAALEAMGIWWVFNEEKTSLSVSLLDFYNDHVSKLGYAGYDKDERKCLSVAKVGLAIEAETGAVKSAADSYSFYAEPNVAVGSFSWNDYDVWATKIVDPVLNLGEGRYDKTMIQYSLDGQSWYDFQAVESAQHSMGTITDLTPSTTYHLRAIFDGWLQVAAPASFTTETAEQVGNPGFEDFVTVSHSFKATLYGSTSNETRDWYLPYSNESEAWWAVNSKITMPSQTTKSSLNFKVAPTVSYYLDAQDDKSAQLVSTYVCNMATSSSDGNGTGGSLGGILSGTTVESYRAAGEIWIGKADDGGYHESDGHSFSSRPSAMKFSYTYAPVNSESFYAKIQIWDDQKKVIASKEITEGASKSSWTDYTMTLDYPDVTKKAAYIYIQFRSSSCADSEVTHNRNKTVKMAGKDYKGHVGSILKIDDIQLIY